MNYDIKIVPEGPNYIGYALRHNEVIFVTKPCRTPQQASAELEKATKSTTAINVSTQANKVSTQHYPTELSRIRASSSNVTNVRGCCGRG